MSEGTAPTILTFAKIGKISTKNGLKIAAAATTAKIALSLHTHHGRGPVPPGGAFKSQLRGTMSKMAAVPTRTKSTFSDIFAHGGLIHGPRHAHGWIGAHISQFLGPVGKVASCHFGAVAILCKSYAHCGLVFGVGPVGESPRRCRGWDRCRKTTCFENIS